MYYIHTDKSIFVIVKRILRIMIQKEFVNQRIKEIISILRSYFYFVTWTLSLANNILIARKSLCSPTMSNSMLRILKHKLKIWKCVKF